MKKLYIEPRIGKGCMMVESALLINSQMKVGADITSGTVEADSRQGSFWDDSE